MSAADFAAEGVVFQIDVGPRRVDILTRIDGVTFQEHAVDGLYFTPNAHLGVVLATLLVCRLAYRFVVGGLPASAIATPPPSVNALTPLTLLLIGTLGGYYCMYAFGLLRRAARGAGAR